MIKHVFRFAIIAYLVFLGAFVIVGLRTIRGFPPEALHYVEWYAQIPMDRAEAITNRLGIASLIVSVISAIALLFYYRPARIGFFIAVLISEFCDLFIKNPLLTTGTLSVLDSMASFFSGAIIALAYFSPIKDHFSRKRPSQ